MRTQLFRMSHMVAFWVILGAGLVQAAPITDPSFFSSVPHTHITFEQDGSGATLPVTSGQTLPSTEYAGLGVSFLPSTRLTQDSDSCFRIVQNIAGGSTPYGLIASQTQSMVFNPPVSAFGCVFVANKFQFATFTARDINGALIETAVFTGPFVHGIGCGFLEYGFIGITSTTPIARVDVAAFSGVMDNLRFALLDADTDGVPDATDNCVSTPNADQDNFDGDAQGDACDPDDDNDGVPDTEDSAPMNRFACRDLDGDTCDDCSSGVENAADDGLDTDADGICNAGDADDDNDDVLDGDDPEPLNRFVCGDADFDGCDDCGVTGGPPDVGNDGTDFDGDGYCDFGDIDDDMDGVPDDQDANLFNRFVCRDADADGCDDCGIVGYPDPANDGADFDADGLCDSGDPDDDNDGLSDADEITFDTDPFVPDTDGDGLLDGTEVDMSMGSGCPSPLVADSDGDTFSDGDETAGGTNPCNTDTDADGIPDNVDPLPTQPGVTANFLDEWTVELATVTVPAVDLSLFNAQNNNANRGRRTALSNRASDAANAIAAGDYALAIEELESLLEKIDDQMPPPDWMSSSPEKTALAEEVRLMIFLLTFF